MSSIASSRATLEGKGYTPAEINAIQFGVPKGGNRRKNALAHAAATLPAKNTQEPTPAPKRPASKPAPVRFETRAAEARKSKDRLRRNRRSSRNKTKLGIGKKNIQPLNSGVFGQTVNY